MRETGKLGATVAAAAPHLRIQSRRRAARVPRVHNGRASGPRHLRHFPPLGMEFRCATCPATFKTKRACTKHSVRHSDAKLTCDLCDTFTCPAFDYTLLRYHQLKMHDGGRPYSCPLGCGYAGRDLTALRVHQRHAHSDARPFRCEEPGCTLAFKSRWSLSRHAVRHQTAAS